MGIGPSPTRLLDRTLLAARSPDSSLEELLSIVLQHSQHDLRLLEQTAQLCERDQPSDPDEALAYRRTGNALAVARQIATRRSA